MRLGLALIDTAFSAHPTIDLDLVRHAEELGFESVWAAEAYGCDAVTSATWLAAHTKRMKVGTAIMQIPARTPAMAAMTTIGLNALSKDRFILGLGSSGPQVVEGWHGSAYYKPLGRTREYVEIVRQILEREKPLNYTGDHYQLPTLDPRATGAGKALKSVAHGNAQQAIYLASISPGGIRLAAEIGDGVLLSFMDPTDTKTIVDKHVYDGLQKEGARSTRDQFTVSTFVNVVVHEDTAAVHAVMQQSMARQLGGMGSKGKNFYAEFARRMGYDAEVEQIQSFYLAGEKEKAAKAVPTDLIDRTSLIGPPERIRERLSDWKEAGQRGSLDLMNLTAKQPEALSLLAEELL